MILLLSFDIHRKGGIERLTIHVKHALESSGYSVKLLTPKTIGPSWWGRQLGRFWFLLQLVPSLLRSKKILSMHVLLLKPVGWLQCCRRRNQSLHCWAHGIEVWGKNQSLHKNELMRCRSLLASSSFTQKQLATLNYDIKVIHPTADLFDPATEPKSLPESLKLLTVARMCRQEHYKGHELIIHAMHKMHQNGELPQGLRWDVIGDGDQRPELEKLVQELGLQPWVCFHGSVSDSELRTAFQQSSVFLMPSHFEIDSQGNASGEGFGIVYLEAALAGRASIGCKEGGQTDLIQDKRTGWLIEPNIPALIDVMRIMFNHPEIIATYGANARKYALKNFSVEHFRVQLMNALMI